jgi:hypothetical protein
MMPDFLGENAEAEPALLGVADSVVLTPRREIHDLPGGCCDPAEQTLRFDVVFSVENHQDNCEMFDHR